MSQIRVSKPNLKRLKAIQQKTVGEPSISKLANIAITNGLEVLDKLLNIKSK